MVALEHKISASLWDRLFGQVVPELAKNGFKAAGDLAQYEAELYSQRVALVEIIKKRSHAYNAKQFFLNKNTVSNWRSSKMNENVKQEIEESINKIFILYPIENNENKDVINALKLNIINSMVNIKNTNIVKEKLETLFFYEKNYLELIKEYKEEIKFASTLQEDLRKERAKFFSSVLDEVSSTLKNSQVDEKVASSWIIELVKSYTGSLDCSANMVSENTLDSISSLRAKARNERDALSIQD